MYVAEAEMAVDYMDGVFLGYPGLLSVAHFMVFSE